MSETLLILGEYGFIPAGICLIFVLTSDCQFMRRWQIATWTLILVGGGYVWLQLPGYELAKIVHAAGSILVIAMGVNLILWFSGKRRAAK